MIEILLSGGVFETVLSIAQKAAERKNMPPKRLNVAILGPHSGVV